MSENKLPEGVGKKIVEALKKQSESDVSVAQVQEDNLDSVLTSEEIAYQDLISEEVEESFIEENVETADFSELSDDSVEDLTYVSEPEPIQYSAEPLNQPESDIQPQYVQPEPSYAYTQQQAYQPQQPAYQRAPEYTAPQYQQAPVQEQEPAQEYNIPANVAVLKRLINQLPQGVSKQTGAQIIRQTMEALGISMSTVLAEAQHFQDDLNVSIKHCASSIQEYKTSIKNLEKQVNDYQRQSMQVNDLISLFIMTDK